MVDLRPHDVFTPNGFPVEENNVYAARADAERSMDRAMARREVPVIYGEFGVGKTTLAKRYFLQEDREGRFVHFLSPAGRSLEDVAKVALEQIGYYVESSRDQQSTATVEGEVEAGLWATLKAKVAGKGETSSSSHWELVVDSPTNQGLLRVLSDREVILAIDEMHKASDRFRAQLAELIKAANNTGHIFPRIIVLGTTADAANLVEQDEGVDRLIREIRVQPMTDDEARFVIEQGMGRLQIEISPDLVNRILSTVAGAPALLQEVCLDIAERVVEGGRDAVEKEDLNAAVREFLLAGHARLTAKYMRAIETVGPKRYRKQVLTAMAESDNDFMTMDELTRRISENLGEEVPSSAISGPLRELKTATYGQILTDVDRPSLDESRVYNLTSFQDARMKAFIRAMRAVEAQDQDLLPSPEEVSMLPGADDDEN